MMLAQINDSESPLVKYALLYASKGWHVFPVHCINNGKCSCGRQCRTPGKHPIISSWNKIATTNTLKIHEFWTKYPYANIGIVTGKSSNLIVLDIDPRNMGGKSLESLIKNNPELTTSLTTLSVATGGSGIHYYFRWRDNQKTKHNAFSGGIDIQSDNAYIIAPPSNHKSGEYYNWNNNNDVLAYPDYLLFQNKLITDTRWQEDILEGSRNSTLASLTGTYFNNGLQRSQVLTKLFEENAMRCKPPLEHHEITQIVDSIKKSAGKDKKSLKTVWQERIVFFKTLTAGETRTLLALSMYMDVDGKGCFPTQELIAEKTNTTRNTVIKHINRAKELGLITTYPRPTGNSKAWSNGYIAILPAD